MAQPKTATWSKLLVQLGDGAVPETFAQPCALVSRGFNVAADTTDSDVPDCDNPDAPTWVQRTIRSFSGEISGEGVLALVSHATWRTWFLSGLAKNVRVKLDVPLADGGGYYAGAFLLTKFALSGNKGDGKVGVSITLVSDGVIAWVPAAS